MASTVGRYAPSPTGRLHLGNLRTALLAWLQVRLRGGQFLLRMEDLDTPRVVEGSADQILRDLEWLGLSWDGPVMWQSDRTEAYIAALNSLEQDNLIYPCFCSRKDLRDAASAPHGATAVYPGHCSNLSQAERTARRQEKEPATRLRVSDQIIRFTDQVLGEQQQSLQSEVGDFVIKRADGLFAYQLAVVVDDLEQGVTDVLRGADLLDSSARQQYLAGLLEPEAPEFTYWHVPLLNDEHGNRMAKRDGSNSLDTWLAQGKTAKQLLGEFAWQLGFIDSSESLNTTELLAHLNAESFQTALQNHVG